jgi:hypothetical protein
MVLMGALIGFTVVGIGDDDDDDECKGSIS